MSSQLEALAAALLAHPNVAEKLAIATAYTPALPVAGGVPVGDDTAAIPDPDGNGYLLLAAEGMMEGFIQLDPWFAGYSAVMVNLSDVAAMGGRPTALVDVLWSHPDHEMTREIWAGMRAASTAYGVPIVGGHTTRHPAGRTPFLAVSVLGRARALITSFGARPGDELLMAVDLRGAWRGQGTLFWNASTGSPPARLQSDLELLATLAEAGLPSAGKDISNGGIPGTLAMLLATSRVGAEVCLDAIPRPPQADLQRWLLAFPSYGYLLTAPPPAAADIRARFQERGLAAATIGVITAGDAIHLSLGEERLLWARVPPAP